MYTAKLVASLLVLVALVFSVTPTQAETVNCTAITSLPAIITVQGIYLVVNNRITSADEGIDYANGSTGKFRDNVTFDVATPYTDGTNIGNNN